MAQQAPTREQLFVPDRFERLRPAGEKALRTIITPVEGALSRLDDRFDDMASAGRGSLLILRGETGVGKSTFLDTVGLFRAGVVTHRIPPDTDVAAELQALGESSHPRILVLEGREALGRVSAAAIEETLHLINAYVRTDEARDTLLVWPTNTEELTVWLVALGVRLGGEALFDVGGAIEEFTGPSQDDFPAIAERTVQALNDGASLAALGIADDRARELAKAPTIGRYLAEIRKALNANRSNVRRLMLVERYRMWTLVIAGNNPENDVAALTRSSQSYVDVDRLVSATDSNAVKDLKKDPAVLGILGTSIDGRILHMDMVTVLAVARTYGDEQLHDLMRADGMSLTATSAITPAQRLETSELGRMLRDNSLGTRKVGQKPGGGTKGLSR